MLNNKQVLLLDKISRERVAAGADFLEHRMLWWFKYSWLDISKLNVEKPDTTVIGMLFHNDYAYALEGLGLNEAQARSYGFAPITEFCLADASVVEAAWIREIKYRRMLWWVAGTIVPFLRGALSVIYPYKRLL
jgi:hypothetical protein